jgi:hypothetical protein
LLFSELQENEPLREKVQALIKKVFMNVKILRMKFQAVSLRNNWKVEILKKDIFFLVQCKRIEKSLCCTGGFSQ